MPSKLELLQEANRRGILSGRHKDLYDEAVRRGLIGSETVSKSIAAEMPQNQTKPFVSPTPNDLIRGNTEGGQAFVDTTKNIAKVYPALEAGANILTSSYGVPISGLVGLLTLPFGVDRASKAVSKTQDALVYTPKTKSGKELLNTASMPSELLGNVASKAGEKTNELVGPNAAAAVHSVISGAPTIVGGGIGLKMAPGKINPIKTLDTKTQKAINTGVAKAIKPSVAGKSSRTQIGKYYKNARVAVEEIIKNKDNLVLVDEDGTRVKGLPKNIDQFSQAIDQTKRSVFERYDALAKSADKNKGVQIGFDSILKELEILKNNKTFQDFSPETIKYIELRIEKLKKRQKDSTYGAIETQDAIQFLNQTLKHFEKDQSPPAKGAAVVDALVANNFRINLDKAIQKATGGDYGELRKTYGSLKAIEADVNKRKMVNERKSPGASIGFSDILTAHQAIKGIAMRDPATIAAGAGMEGVSMLKRKLSNPDRMVQKMFGDVEKLMEKTKKESTRIR